MAVFSVQLAQSFSTKPPAVIFGQFSYWPKLSSKTPSIAPNHLSQGNYIDLFDPPQVRRKARELGLYRCLTDRLRALAKLQRENGDPKSAHINNWVSDQLAHDVSGEIDASSTHRSHDAITVFMNNLADFHPETLHHSTRVMRYGMLIGRQMGLDAEAMDVLKKSLLAHDVGKLAVPGRILSKPGKPTPLEYQIIQQHTTLGGRLLQCFDLGKWGRGMFQTAVGHHESPNKKGYPHAQKAAQLPLITQIAKVADEFDAMTSYRSYRKPGDIHELLTSFYHDWLSWQGINPYAEAPQARRYEPKVLEAFMEVPLKNIVEVMALHRSLGFDQLKHFHQAVNTFAPEVTIWDYVYPGNAKDPTHTDTFKAFETLYYQGMQPNSKAQLKPNGILQHVA